MKLILTEKAQKQMYTFEASIFDENGIKKLSFTSDAESKEDFILRYSEKICEFIGIPDATLELNG